MGQVVCSEFVAWAKAYEGPKFHAVLCDPPYGLEFMGKEWDAPWKRGRVADYQSTTGFVPKGLFGRTTLPQLKWDGNRKCKKCGKWAWDYPDRKCICDLPDFPVDTSFECSYQEWTREWAAVLIPLLYPGALVFAFGGTRTWHRLACGFEDAGFQIWDTLMWLHGQGFPKAQDISKLIDKALFTTRTMNPDFQKVRAWVRAKVKAKGLTYKEIDAALGNENSHKASHYLDNSQPQLPTPQDWQIIKGLLELKEDEIDRPPKLLIETFEREIVGYRKVSRGVAFTSEGPSELPITKPLSIEAANWSGHKTAALKPAWEPVLCFKAPNQGKTYAELALEYGSGALNVDGGRIGVSTDDQNWRDNPTSGESGRHIFGKPLGEQEIKNLSGLGRYPANLALECTCGWTEIVNARDSDPRRADGSVNHGGRGPYHASSSVKIEQGHPGGYGGKAIRHTDPTCPAAMLDAQAGECGASAPVLGTEDSETGQSGIYGRYKRMAGPFAGDKGGPSRFFYCSKASRSEREAGLEHIEIVEVETWDQEGRDHKVRLRVDTATLPLRVIGESMQGDASAWNTMLFGNGIAALSQQGCKYTMSMRSNSTIESRTLNYVTHLLTSADIAVANCEMENGGSPVASAGISSPLLTITNGQMGFRLGADNAALITRLRIRGNVGPASDHPTMKPLALCRWLATLLLPPESVKPRRLLVPFSGSGSEIIAALQAGWDEVVGVEQDSHYCDIARARLTHWTESKAPLFSSAEQEGKHVLG